MMEIRKLGALSAAKVLGTLYAIFGLLFGLFFALMLLLGTLLGASGSEQFGQALGFGIGGGVVGIILMPLFYGAVGAIAGLVSAAIYNLVARMVGGIKIETR